MRFLAALALLMHVCWPFVGQLRAATLSTVQVICSVHGTMQMPSDEAPQPGATKPSCAMCSAAGLALDSSFIGPAMPPVAAEQDVAQIQPVAPAQRVLHSRPSPRAPPQVS
jgi:hypothetical protein